MLSNAILYNKPGTAFSKTAQRMQTTVQPILDELTSLRYQHPNADSAEPSVGDFEAPLDVLRLLVSQEEIKNAITLILETDPLNSLFNYELGRIKPPPPPPPPKPKASKKKSAKAHKMAEPGVLDTAPGFRAPRTRRALAAAAAFEAEAASVAADEQMAEPGGTDATEKPIKVRIAGQPDAPPMVEDVDSQGSFKMFDAGWILPTGQKRRGRQAVERPPLPPPKKRMRTCAYCASMLFGTGLWRVLAERGTSKLSTISTTVSENQTMPGTVPPGPSTEETAPEDVPMDVEEPEPEPPVSVPVPALEPIPEPMPEPIPEPVPEAIPEPIPEPVPEPVAEPVREPVHEPVHEPAPAPAPEPIPEPLPEPVHEPEPAPEPIPESLPESAHRPEPASEPMPESLPEPEPALEPEPEPEAALEPELVLELVPEPEIQAEPEPVPKPEFVPAPAPAPAPALAPAFAPALVPASVPEPKPAPALVPVPAVPAPPPEVHAEGTQPDDLAARIAAIPKDPYTKIIAVGGKIIIEELDTPATRREKASRRKAEKKAAAAAAAAAAQASTRDKGNGHESDLSSLSELESEEEAGGTRCKERHVKAPLPAPPVAGPSTAPPPGPGVVVLPEGKTLEGGTLGTCSCCMVVHVLTTVRLSSLGQSKFV